MSDSNTKNSTYHYDKREKSKTVINKSPASNKYKSLKNTYHPKNNLKDNIISNKSKYKPKN